MDAKPCVRCLSQKVKRLRAGEKRMFAIIQCMSCGFNTTSNNFENALYKWNDFKVWTLVPENKLLTS